MFNTFIKKIWAPVVNSDEDEAKEREELGITEELIQLVDNISRFPESFKDFPYQTLKDPSLKMSKLQKRHVQKILEIVKPLSDLRFQICPSVMNDEKFWTIYFTHIQVVSKGIFGTNIQQIPSSSSTSKPVDILDELDSQFDKLSTKKKPFDEGISEEEDSYFSLNTFVLQSQLQAQQQQQQQQTTSLKSSTSSLSSSTSSLSSTPNKSKNNLQIGTNRPITVSASSPPQTTTTTTNNTTNTNNNILASPNNNDKILNNTEPLTIDNNILNPEQRNNNLDKNIDNFLNPS